MHNHLSPIRHWCCYFSQLFISTAVIVYSNIFVVTADPRIVPTTVQCSHQHIKLASFIGEAIKTNSARHSKPRPAVCCISSLWKSIAMVLEPFSICHETVMTTAVMTTMILEPFSICHETVMTTNSCHRFAEILQTNWRHKQSLAGWHHSQDNVGLLQYISNWWL